MSQNLAHIALNLILYNGHQFNISSNGNGAMPHGDARIYAYLLVKCIHTLGLCITGGSSSETSSSPLFTYSPRKISEPERFIIIPRRDGGGGAFGRPPQVFLWIAQNGGAQRRYFWPTCSDIFSAHYVKILTPGQVRSGHQASSRDPTSEKV